jgi:hypothetical protein
MSQVRTKAKCFQSSTAICNAQHTQTVDWRWGLVRSIEDTSLSIRPQSDGFKSSLRRA